MSYSHEKEKRKLCELDIDSKLKYQYTNKRYDFAKRFAHEKEMEAEL